MTGKPFLCLFFVAENLYDLLPVYHFFNVSVYITYAPLLFHKVFSALGSYLLYDYEDQACKHQHYEGEPYAQVYHGDKNGDH